MKNSVGSKQAKTSRKEAGPRAVVQAKNPGQQGGQIVVNAEYLQRIEVLSEENEIENCDFRAWLKNYAPDDIDDIVKAWNWNSQSPNFTGSQSQWSNR